MVVDVGRGRVVGRRSRSRRRCRGRWTRCRRWWSRRASERGGRGYERVDDDGGTRAAAPAGAARPGLGVPVAPSGLPARRRWGRVAAGGVLALVGAWTAASLYASAGERVEVVVVAGEVDRFEEIARDDLKVVRVACGPGRRHDPGCGAGRSGGPGGGDRPVRRRAAVARTSWSARTSGWSAATRRWSAPGSVRAPRRGARWWVARRCWWWSARRRPTRTPRWWRWRAGWRMSASRTRPPASGRRRWWCRPGRRRRWRRPPRTSGSRSWPSRASGGG